MTSPKQIAANQRNAQQSTGPRSPAGKGVSRANAARHGLTATTVLLPGEDHEEFDEHRQLLLADLQPVGAVEMLLAERVVVAALQLRRHTAMESSLLHFLVLTARAAIAKEETAEMSDFDLQGLMAPYGKGKEYAEAMTRAELATHASRGDDALLGRAIDLGVTRGDALARLTRYSVTAERSLYRALHELERARARRLGHAVTPPLALDVSCDGFVSHGDTSAP